MNSRTALGLVATEVTTISCTVRTAGLPIAWSRRLRGLRKFVEVVSWKKDVGFHGSDIKTPNLDGGPRSAQFTGEIDMSKSTIPADNGPYRDGKGTLYEGGTRVVALADWPGHIKPGSVVDQPIHIVDMYPTLLGLAGASVNKSKTLDGLNVWPVISEGKPSPRNEVIYNIGPFFAAVREGDWKLVWQTALPSRIELFNLAQDPSEQNDLAEKNPQKVAELQQRIQKLAQEAAQPLFLKDALGATKHVLFGSVATPDEEKDLEMQP